MKAFLIALLLTLAAQASPQAALELLVKAHTSPPTEAVELATQAHQLLSKSEKPNLLDLAACATTAARAYLTLNDPESAVLWFEKAKVDPAARAELADLHLKAGRPSQALQSLQPEAATPQWHQTKGKILLTTGSAEAAVQSFQTALSLLPEESTVSHQSLLIDLAGAHTRNDDWPSARPVLSKAAELFQTVQHHPAVVTAFATLSASDPQLSPEESLTLLSEATELLGEPSLPLQAALATAYAQNAHNGKAGVIAKELISQLEENHPLRVQLLAIAAWAENDKELAYQSSREASQWISNNPHLTRDQLTGISKTVDPISPLVPFLDDPETFKLLNETAWKHFNLNLRRRLNSAPLTPPSSGTHVLYFTYDKLWPDREEQLGAIIYDNGQSRFQKLGPTAKIYKRIRAVISTAESTSAETGTNTASLDTRLTALWKSIWEPLSISPGSLVTVHSENFLNFVPWPGLRSKAGSYLLEQLEFPVAGPENTAGGKGLSIGFTTAPPSTKLPELPAVSKELDLVGLPKELNPSTRDFLEALPNKKTLHISGHGLLTEEGESAICTTDRIIPASEIATLDLSGTSLVVLSLCRGGLGIAETGGNWTSLQQAFLVAGAKNCIAARWQVRDDLTAEFMRDLYGHLASQPPAQALALTQRVWFSKKDLQSLATAAAWSCERTPF